MKLPKLIEKNLRLSAAAIASLAITCVLVPVLLAASTPLLIALICIASAAMLCSLWLIKKSFTGSVQPSRQQEGEGAAGKRNPPHALSSSTLQLYINVYQQQSTILQSHRDQDIKELVVICVDDAQMMDVTIVKTGKSFTINLNKPCSLQTIVDQCIIANNNKDISQQIFATICHTSETSGGEIKLPRPKISSK
jgi:hypothetical protein